MWSNTNTNHYKLTDVSNLAQHSGSLAMFTAIRRTSSQVNSLAALAKMREPAGGSIRPGPQHSRARR
jgi:hypothetical protein